MASKVPSFSHTQDQLKELAQDTLRYAKKLGALQASVQISEGGGLSVGVRCGQIDTIEKNLEKSISVTVYLDAEGDKKRCKKLGIRQGNASTSDFSSRAIHSTVAAAYDLARFVAEDTCAGLADSALLEHAPQDLDLYHPWALDPDQAADIAKRAEQAAFDVDARISQSEGANVSTEYSQFVLATSHGFMGGYPYTNHSISCAPIAGQGRFMQRDYWYTSKCRAADLAQPEAIGSYAAQRALARLGSRSLSTRKCPVLFEAPLAIGLMGAFVQAVSGGALYRDMSFLKDCLGKPIFTQHIGLTEDPHLPRAVGSSAFDGEGVRTHKREVIEKGVVQGYFLSSWSARKLGMQTTGNAGGSHNLVLHSSETRPSDNFQAMLKKLDTGLLVTDVMGQGINYVTGDYSRGAAGFWVENGEIQYPVEEITIASTLQKMFKNMVAIGADQIIRGSKSTGSILIEEMSVAGLGA